jgi:hypothetical protein
MNHVEKLSPRTLCFVDCALSYLLRDVGQFCTPLCRRPGTEGRADGATEPSFLRTTAARYLRPIQLLVQSKHLMWQIRCDVHTVLPGMSQ